MHELYAQADETSVRTLIWHALCPGGTHVSLCGLHLEPRPGTGEEGKAGVLEALDRYCPSCMDAIRAAMAAAHYS
ncbi:hypothetical protein ABIE67_010099 [Streptomyces sp. V4I8]